MTKETLIKSAIKALVNEQVKQGSWGYALEEDSAYEVSWQNVLEWLELQPSKACISREDIFKRFKELKFYTNHKGMRIVQLVDVIDCVFDAPSVQPQRNKGKWIKTRGLGWKCSVCRNVSSLIQCNFCPECGADMRGDENG